MVKMNVGEGEEIARKGICKKEIEKKYERSRMAVEGGKKLCARKKFVQDKELSELCESQCGMISGMGTDVDSGVGADLGRSLQGEQLRRRAQDGEERKEGEQMNYEVVRNISRNLNRQLSRGVGDECVKNLVTQVSYSHLFTLLKNILTYLPFSINDYLIGTLELKEIIDNKYNTCFQLYKKEELMNHIYENESKNLVDNKVFNLFCKYKIMKNKKGPLNHMHVLNFQEGGKEQNLESILIDKSRIFMYKIHSFIEGRDLNLSYIYEICHGLGYKTETFLLSVFIFDSYIHTINKMTEKNHYRKIKLLVIICSILLALIKTQVFNGSSIMYLNDILYLVNKLRHDKVNYTCIEIANKQMEIIKFLPLNYNNYWTYSELTYVYLINLKGCSKKYPAIKIYYIFLEHFGFLYFLFDVIYAYSMYITAVGSYKVIPASRVVATIILYFTNAFYNRMSNSLLFQENFCQEVFHLPFANDLFMWSYLLLNNFIYFFEHCVFPNKNYSSIYSIFYETGRMLNIRTVF
ncbi:conserved Plasmodium protein, unknown function [Plasmodium knowlesi strain H]|uniref:Uncharacterized protein n=3 Tax=Plasmodium knowlesi TaxID=5850 RepID=A0A5K1U3Y8_PLAKH|nr:conserved Plasmodium protein, unknown function [Plasmodium knowlesi strain H]OTN65624.1 Uncharacterized protein PKNOH_S110075200 [Plasmodium knowlesi]CAA9989373.1 conserved Plasmodium protein, unknown function [Plasmodium knowlesi strain H]SBO24955.1 conserved Plasmodium protein, unknown function [Plasmodium knowlesi strain H]SBO27899.1 conserved Plasmodium protein, unknown function [Plasmodium knowlesi strain H]VVS78847.1 conserved Plasmodium protein, unknown function [Plasmodium knowlesi |eukprot:XP_002260100.1 hypothetical protein, conserved in Plasmodium species [Plasmodium knowlesi strain H]